MWKVIYEEIWPDVFSDGEKSFYWSIKKSAQSDNGYGRRVWKLLGNFLRVVKSSVGEKVLKLSTEREEIRHSEQIAARLMDAKTARPKQKYFHNRVFLLANSFSVSIVEMRFADIPSSSDSVCSS